MFVLDIETVDSESTAGILSVALVYLDENIESSHTYESLLEEVFFIKLDIKDQMQNYKRTISKDTMNWWKKLPIDIQKSSLIPHLDDVKVKDAIKALKGFVKLKSKNPKKELIWTRGSLDQMALDSLFKATGEEILFPFWMYRDMRTFVALVSKDAIRGYGKIDSEKYPENWSDSKVKKHDCRHDVVYDLCQLLYS